MPAFAGVDHLSLSVTDLDVSERFYTDVLDFSHVMDFGEVRVLLHRATGFMLSLYRHTDGHRVPFSERNPGLDHLGLTAATRDELVAWEQRFAAAGVSFTPIRDMPFGAHLNFRDPDGIPLEFSVANALLTAAMHELRERDVPREEIRARVEAALAAAASGEGRR